MSGSENVNVAGGHGTSTFGLPDLRGRTAVCKGLGPGISDYVLGEFAGTENQTMLYSNMPQHTYLVNVSEVKTGSGPNAQTDYFYNAGPVNFNFEPRGTHCIRLKYTI